jgi:hypothetical protein
MSRNLKTILVFSGAATTFHPVFRKSGDSLQGKTTQFGDRPYFETRLSKLPMKTGL